MPPLFKGKFLVKGIGTPSKVLTFVGHFSLSLNIVDIVYMHITCFFVESE